ncbi:MAG: hypothetical protein II841_05120, partial [Bacteroidales bacterium]|nr:hypothetical protein [Bacteroidales bacterium]
MKEFVKTTLAVICGIVVIRIIGFIFMLVMFGSALAGSTTVVPRTGVLDVDMSAFTLAEETQESPMPTSLAFFSGGMVPVLGVRDAVQALSAAASDPGIQFVLVRADALSAGMADVEEFRKALLRVRQSGKAVIAYTENPGNGSY